MAAPRTNIIVPIVIVAVAIVVALGIIFIPQIGGGANGADDTGIAGGVKVEHVEMGVLPSIQDGGATIVALERPSIVQLASVEEEAPAPAVTTIDASPDLGNVVGIDDMYLSDQQKELLARNSFCVEVGTAGYEFHEVYEMNRYGMYPSFVTVDSMMHAYHLYFAHLMKSSERTRLAPALLSCSQEMLALSEQQLEALRGTEWEQAALRNVAFFAVGASLQDAGTQVPAEVSDAVNYELGNIMQASSMAESALFIDETGAAIVEDYSQYKPRGYYEGDEQLEAYFRAMMWYGRANFTQKVEDLDRSALLVTMALSGEAFDNWEAIYTVSSFFAGASDDCIWYEYKPLLDAAYGADANAASLPGDEGAWNHFHELTAAMPAPAINSMIVKDEGQDADHEAEQKGFRFMGQRFTIDAAIMQNLIYNKVGSNAAGDNRLLPDALDVPAALGSDEALGILESQGDTGYAGYTENLEQLRSVYAADDPALWQASLYAQWLYTLNPLLEAKGEGYPTFMQSSEWNRKNLQSYLGSYTELKHDTVLYSKQAIAEMGGGVPDRDDRGYVEPEPTVYARLAALTQATSEGLAKYGMIEQRDADNLALLQELASRLQAIATKELAGESLSEDDYELIRTFGGQLEHFWEEVYDADINDTAPYHSTRDFPSAVVVDVATNPDAGTVLELGTGKVSKMHVLFPIDGELHVGIGAVYSFYQFEQPQSDRLTDSQWREMMGIQSSQGYPTGEPVAQHVEDWTLDFQYERETSY